MSSLDAKATSVQRPEPLEKRTVDKQETSRVDSADLLQGDEALYLVGIECSVQFSDEYNARLRRKLVGLSSPCFSSITLAPFNSDFVTRY
jgi:hemin uptake protein HemP